MTRTKLAYRQAGLFAAVEKSQIPGRLLAISFQQSAKEIRSLSLVVAHLIADT